jgi:hypothetical protein
MVMALRLLHSTMSVNSPKVWATRQAEADRTTPQASQIWPTACSFRIELGTRDSYQKATFASPLNELSSNPFQIDFLTGAATGFNSRRVSPEQWRATVELNRKRSRSLKAIHGQSASWGEISPDVWAQRVAEQARALEVPVVDLLAIAIDADEFGEWVSLVPGLVRLDCG